MEAILKSRIWMVFSIVALISINIACSDQLQSMKGAPKSKQMGEEATLKENYSVLYIASNGDSIEVELFQIEDSRCPEDVVCVWAGDVRVGFRIENLDVLYQLCLGSSGQSCTNSKEFSLNDNNFLIRLVDVKPYNNTQSPDSIKTATFVVTEF